MIEIIDLVLKEFNLTINVWENRHEEGGTK